MTRISAAGALALAFGLSSAFGFREIQSEDTQFDDTSDFSPQEASSCPDPQTMSFAQITGERVYTSANASDATDNLNHRDYILSTTDTCGFLIESSVLSILDSNLTKPAYTGQVKLNPIYGSAAVCVINQSTFDLDHGSITTSGNNQVGVWAWGLNTTVHVTDISVENTNTQLGFGLVADHEAVMMADRVEYTSDFLSSTCAFGADGGEITVHQSTAHLSGLYSPIFCSLGGGEALGQIHSQDVLGVSEKGPGVLLTGNTWLAAFTNTTLIADGPAISSGRQGAGVLNDTVIRVTSSSLTATNPLYPVLFFMRKEVDAIFHRTEMIPPSTNVLLHAACSAHGSDVCDPFRAMVLVSESTIDPAFLTWKLSSYTTWTGAVVSNETNQIFGSPPVNILIDNSSRWNVTKESWVQALASSQGDLANVFVAEPGVIVHYNGSHVLNAYLEGKTLDLEGGGSAQPF